MVVVAAVSLCIVGATIGAASAATDAVKTDPMSGLVAAVASKFNLNTTDVQAVFDEQKAKMNVERATGRQQRFADRLTKAVADGKLTQAQADLITAKKSELEAARASLETKTPAERRAAMEAQATALKQWAADNNIPDGYLSCQGPGRMGGHRGFEFGNKQGDANR